MSETLSMTLTDFLLARIAEDEAVAQAASSGPWDWTLDYFSDGSLENCRLLSSDTWTERGAAYRSSVFSVSGMHTEGYLDCEPGDRDHIARHDPARVLAECEAKRRIVERWRAPSVGEYYGDGYAAATDEALRDLASVYGDHPDYRDEWRA